MRRFRILIADPDRTALERAVNILSPFYDVQTAREPLRAVDLLLERPFALAMLDRCLPVIGGLDLARMLRNDARFNRMPILLLSNEPFQLADVRVQGVVLKPLGSAPLLLSVRQALARPTPAFNRSSQAAGREPRAEVTHNVVRIDPNPCGQQSSAPPPAA